MKSALAAATISLYSFFAFIYAVVCPAICLGVDASSICSAVCESESQPTSSCCAEPCAIECEQVEPLAVCSGAYGTQNSIRGDCTCPLPAKTPAMIELYRLLKNTDSFALACFADILPKAELTCGRIPDSPPRLFHTGIISSTVLRI